MCFEPSKPEQVTLPLLRRHDLKRPYMVDDGTGQLTKESCEAIADFIRDAFLEPQSFEQSIRCGVTADDRSACTLRARLYGFITSQED